MQATRPLYHPDAGSGVAAGTARGATLAALWANNVLRDGEIVLMVLKPSLWFIFFNAAGFIAVTWVIGMALALYDQRMHDRLYFDLATFITIGRLTWAILQWMGRLYVLTDMRVLRISGVFTVDFFECALRKVVRTRLVSSIREKLVHVGSIEIIPQDEDSPTFVWQTVSNPREVHERLQAAITRARQNGNCAG